MDISFHFPTTDAAYNCMKAIDQIADWNVARQYGAYGYYVHINAEYLAKESRQVQHGIMAIIAMFGGEQR